MGRCLYKGDVVALRKESVDRNSDCRVFADVVAEVALRKESVDRNVNFAPGPQVLPPVALRKESVDRNHQEGRVGHLREPSLSARRAWIEI